MAWRIVKQPNGKYARFSDPVDNFTHYDMSREEAVQYCQNEIGLKAGETKVLRADEEPGRWKDSLETIEDIHGWEERCKVEALILLSDIPPNPKLTLYYIQDTRTYVGNSVVWWRVGGNGYTCELRDAWKVPASWRGRETDKLWPCSDIDAGAVLNFDMQLLRGLKPLEGKTNG